MSSKAWHVMDEHDEIVSGPTTLVGVRKKIARYEGVITESVSLSAPDEEQIRKAIVALPKKDGGQEWESKYRAIHTSEVEAL